GGGGDGLAEPGKGRLAVAAKVPGHGQARGDRADAAGRGVAAGVVMLVPPWSGQSDDVHLAARTIQPFSQKSRTATVLQVFQIGLYDSRMSFPPKRCAATNGSTPRRLIGRAPHDESRAADGGARAPRT
ncbi:hypothetical protein BU14_3176s0001, partial [Porphyra umbilicalis]